MNIKRFANLFLLAALLMPVATKAQTCVPMPHDSLPFVEDFSSWNTGVNGPIGTCWSRFCSYGNFYDGPFIQQQSESTPSGYAMNKRMLFRASPGELTEYVALPPMSDVRELTVDFKVKRPNAHPAMEVGVMEDDDTSTFYPIQLCAPTTYNQWTSYSVSLSAYTGFGDRIAFRAKSVGSNLADIFLDDITVWVDSCAAPCCLTASNFTDSSIDLTWIAVDETADFLLTVAGVDTVVVSGNQYTLNGLSPMTEYTVTLQILCSSGTSAPYTTTFQTPVLALPYHEHFDVIATPAGWKKIGGGQIALNSYSYDGAAALCFLDGAYDNVALLPVFPLEVSDLYIDFFARPSGTPLHGSAVLDVGYVTDADNAATFHAVATLQRDEFPASAYGERHVTFEGVPAGARMALRHQGGSYYGNWLVDNLEVGDARCPAPWERSVDSLGATGARLSWRAVDEWVDYLVAFGNDTTVITDTVLSLSMLTPDSDYVARLARICDDGDTSAWVNLFFRTDCLPLTHADMPYMENFESYATGQNGDLNPINPCWRMLHPGGYGSTNSPLVNLFDGTKTLLIGAYGSTCDYVALPAADTVSGLTLSFQTNTTTLDKVYDVGVMTDHDDLSTFTQLHTFSPVSAGVWETWELPLTNYNGNGKYVAIRIRKAPGETEYLNVYLDNVTLSLTDLCPRPAAVTVESVSDTTATVTVNDPAGVGNYRLTLSSSYGTDSVIVNSNTYTFTNLHPSSSYSISTCALCSDGTATEAVTASFSTACTAIASLPFWENFDYTLSGTIPACWNYWPSNAIRPPHVVDITDASHFSPDGSPSLYLEAGFFRTNDYAVLPTFDVALDTLEISFWYRYGDVTRGTLSVGYISGYPSGLHFGETFDFVALEDIAPVSGAGSNITVSLDSIPDSATHIVIRWSNNQGNATVCIDNITVDFIPPIVPPTPDTVWRTVTVTTNADGAPEPYGSGLYADSSMVEIGYQLADTAAVGGHWQFLGWSDGPTETPRTILVASDTTIIAHFQWVADSTEGIVGVENGKLKVEIFPNPSHGDVTIVVSGQWSVASVSVVDLTGRTVVPPTAINSSLLIPHSTLPTGTYFVRVTTDAGTAVRKLIVE